LKSHFSYDLIFVPSGCGRERRQFELAKEERSATHARVSLEDLLPVVEEVADEDGVLDVVGLKDCGEEAGDLLGLGSELDGLACERETSSA
jgi:hypothetical protein